METNENKTLTYTIPIPNWIAFDDSEEPALEVIKCSPWDESALSLWINTRNQRDYFFRRGQVREILDSADYDTYAINLPINRSNDLAQVIGMAIIHHHSTLLNLYLDPEWRSKGIGRRAIELLAPAIIRAKSDMTSGDPTGFYRKIGYRITAEKQGKNGNITILQI